MMSPFRLVCAGCLLSLSLLLAACSSSMPSAPEAAVQTLVNAVAKADADTIIALYPLDRVPESQVPQMKQQVREGAGRAAAQMNAWGGVERVDIVESTLADDGQIANLRATVVFGNGREEAIRVRLRREESQWHIILVSGLGL